MVSQIKYTYYAGDLIPLEKLPRWVLMQKWGKKFSIFSENVWEVVTYDVKCLESLSNIFYLGKCFFHKHHLFCVWSPSISCQYVWICVLVQVWLANQDLRNLKFEGRMRRNGFYVLREHLHHLKKISSI
jgi:hypothetical protein